MTAEYNKALKEQAEGNVWSTLKAEVAGMSNVQKVQVTADIAGIFDPTPTSDAIGGVASAIQGDWLGVGLSLLGMIPYVGDAGKIGKIARIAPRTAKALETVLKASDKLASAGRAGLEKAGLTLQQVAAARAKAAAKVREQMLAARRRDPNCQRCKGPKGEKRTLQMPKDGPNGKWKPGEPDADGNGTFEFAKEKTLPDGTKVKSIKFENGSPNFDAYVKGGKHDLWEVSGDAGTDGAALTRQMREGGRSYNPPDADDYVLHHFEDGKVGYVPREIHDKAGGAAGDGGVAHTGGNSMLNNDVF
ncbi:MAG: hypothetical protein ACRCS3_12410 [Paracoccaceae bacterium]